MRSIVYRLVAGALLLAVGSSLVYSADDNLPRDNPRGGAVDGLPMHRMAAPVIDIPTGEPPAAYEWGVGAELYCEMRATSINYNDVHHWLDFVINVDLVDLCMAKLECSTPHGPQNPFLKDLCKAKGYNYPMMARYSSWVWGELTKKARSIDPGYPSNISTTRSNQGVGVLAPQYSIPLPNWDGPLTDPNAFAHTGIFGSTDDVAARVQKAQLAAAQAEIDSQHAAEAQAYHEREEADRQRRLRQQQSNGSFMSFPVIDYKRNYAGACGGCLAQALTSPGFTPSESHQMCCRAGDRPVCDRISSMQCSCVTQRECMSNH